jgi:primosomal protein N' (replication factor Y)
LIEVAVKAPIQKKFTYTHPDPLEPGVRVLVPFGKRKIPGIVLGKRDPAGDLAEIELKSVSEVVDDEPIFSPVMMRIADWMADYYCHPLGEVYATMLPAGVKMQVKTSYSLTAKGKKLVEKGDSFYLGVLKALEAGPLSGAKLSSQWKKEAKVCPALADESYDVLIKQGLVKKVRAKEIKGRDQKKSTQNASEWREKEAPFPLSADQERALGTILQDGQDKPVLLFGLTGSGKTEIYLRLISIVHRLHSQLDRSAQALVMVPEISLTPQMTRIFQDRFPDSVAVVHSQLTPTQRWSEYEKIRHGQANILIGPRSAVFGPFRNLKLIIVDEEHDASYKQTSGLHYNARDISILRGKLEGALVVLGSATPSIESYYNATLGKYALVKLEQRVSGKPLPTVEVVRSQLKPKVDLLTQATLPSEQDAGELPIEESIIEELRNQIARGQQSIVIVNRRGYAYYLFSLTQKKAITCPSCSISLTVHQRSSMLRCHYCEYRTTTKAVLAQHPDDQFVTIGYGSQQAEAFLKQKLPEARIVRVDSDSAQKKDMLHNTLQDFRDQKIDILLGTQMLAKGHDFPKVTLTVILEADESLNLPDFRAGERTFQLIVQAAGRSGRAELPGKVMIQTRRSDHPVLLAGVNQDFFGFARGELEFRKSLRYPPFNRIVAIELSGKNENKIDEVCRNIDRHLWDLRERFPAAFNGVRILGPSTPAIDLVRGQYRRLITLFGEDLVNLRKLAKAIINVMESLPSDISHKIDVDPISLI